MSCLPILPQQQNSQSFAVGPVFSEEWVFGGRRLLLAGRESKLASLWDLETGTEIRTFRGHTEAVWVVAFSPDGTQVATAAGRYDPGESTDDSVRLWDIASGKEIRRFDARPPPALVQMIQFSPDGRRLLSVNNWGVRVWDIATGSELFVLGSTSTPTRHSGSFSSDMRTILARARDWFGVVDYTTGQERCTIAPISKANSVADLSPDGEPIVTVPNGIIDAHGTAQIWETGACQQVQAFAASTTVLTRVSFSADGHSVVANLAGPASAQLWDAQSGEGIRRFVPPGGHEVWNVLLSPDGKRLLMKWNFLKQNTPVNETSLWDVQSGRELHRFDEDQGHFFVVGFSPDSATIPVIDGYHLSRTRYGTPGRVS